MKGGSAPRCPYTLYIIWVSDPPTILENERREVSYSILPPISRVRNRAIRTKAAPNVAREGKVLAAYRENSAWES